MEPLLLQQMSKMSMIYGELEEISKINIFSEWVRNQIFGDLIKNNNLRKKTEIFYNKLLVEALLMKMFFIL